MGVCFSLFVEVIPSTKSIFKMHEGEYMGYFVSDLAQSLLTTVLMIIFTIISAKKWKTVIKYSSLVSIFLMTASFPF